MPAPSAVFSTSVPWQMAYSGRMARAVKRLRQKASGTTTHHTKQLSKRKVMHFHPALAPFKAAVLPLSKKLGPKATEVYHMLQKDFMVDYDEAGSIGKRYRREDEIGTPYCITVDFQTVGDENTPADDCVTVRDRDTMEQVRIPVSQLKAYIEEKCRF